MPRERQPSRTIATANLKGGVGKSITALNVGMGMAQLGAHVLLVDVDLQGRLALWMNVEPPRTLYEAVSGETVPAAVVHPLRERFDLIASGGGALAGLLHRMRETALPTVLRDTLGRLPDVYDVILLDCGPGMDPLTIAAYTAANEVVIPAATNRAGADGLVDQVQTVQRLQDGGYPLMITAVIPTLYDAQLKEHRRWLEEYQTQLPEVTTAPIRFDVKLQEQPRTGQTIFELASRSRAAADYGVLARRLLYGQ